MATGQPLKSKLQEGEGKDSRHEWKTEVGLPMVRAAKDEGGHDSEGAELFKQQQPRSDKHVDLSWCSGLHVNLLHSHHLYNARVHF